MTENGFVEYRVKSVTRYIVTRYEECGGNKTASACGRGEFDNADSAYEVAYALCRSDHERLGYELGSDMIKYPVHPNEGRVTDSGDIVSLKI